MASLEDDYSWSPPSEAELKVIEARRERNNKISSLMGQYLLKGYKMLAITCPQCECVLLEDRQTNKYCVGCCEVDADTRKDNPAVSEEAARRAVEEIQHRQMPDKGLPVVLNSGMEINLQTSGEPIGGTGGPPTLAGSSSSAALGGLSMHNSDATTSLSAATSTTDTQSCQRRSSCKCRLVHGVDLHEDVATAVTSLREKISWASKQLQSTTSVHEAQTLANLISDSCRAIAALREL